MPCKWFLFIGNKFVGKIYIFSGWYDQHAPSYCKVHTLHLQHWLHFWRKKPPGKGSFKIWAELHRRSAESNHVWSAVSGSSQIFSTHPLSLNKNRNCWSLWTSENLYLQRRTLFSAVTAATSEEKHSETDLKLKRNTLQLFYQSF